jgi:hypothetical protein
MVEPGCPVTSVFPPAGPLAPRAQRFQFDNNGYPNLIDTGISRVLQMTKFAIYGILKEEAWPMVVFDPSVIPRLL